jgi:ABC-type branched-subunit amino acid transport system ATPase component
MYQMSKEKPFGLYLYKKKSSDHIVLKELLQFVRTISPSQGSSFSYIEAKTSLHPHLSLWENLQIESGTSNWKDFHQSLNPEQTALVNLLKEPSRKCSDAQVWEKFVVSLLKGMISPSRNLLVDMNEESLSPFLIQNFKKSVLSVANSKTVYLASANTSLWLDCAHSIVDRKEYKFEIQSLNSEIIKKHWAA